MTETTGEKGGFKRREHLLSIEKWAQELWDREAAFEVDPDPTKEKYFVTFPYAYMNGRLHAGHIFSMSKAEFAVRFETLQGKLGFFPYSWHCTGMPIAAAALRLQKEFTEAKKEPQAVDDAAQEAKKSPKEEEEKEEETIKLGGFKAKKTKTVAKTGDVILQSDILRKMEIPEEEITKFQDPHHWLNYFPPLGKLDLEQMGFAIDWRRHFVTTDRNPFYDAFIKWQFRKLKDDYIRFGKRECVFSMSVNQPCADHDRASGEGVGPQEYTLIKLKVKEHKPIWADVVGDREMFFVCATLRPETMYGQTNCFVLPEGDYGLYEMHNNEVFVTAHRAALNMIYQDMGPYDVDGHERVPKCLLQVTGMDLIGTPLSAPLATYDTVYALPMLTILMNKGSGIVTSVPADAPDDYAALMDWKTKPKWREDYGVKEEWLQVEVVRIVNVPDSEYGDASAPYIYEKMKIKSHKDKEKLTLAKKEVYLKGFYEGILIVGEFAGTPVKDAKDKVKAKMIAANQAIKYFEPESKVVSRSGDECVVALCDQWYLDYGNEEWTARVRKFVEEKLATNSTSAHKMFLHTVDWLKAWACSRTFGLGTKLPWDEQWVVESLSDSTIYFAYYTIAHFLQGGNMMGVTKTGAPPGPYKITPEDMTDDVFDYIFGLREDVPQSTIAERYLTQMREEFHYWYPVDLRVSGKDLITNHLTMALFNHAAIWKDESMWPRKIYTNGFVLVDGDKMSKSKGNFLTGTDLKKKFSADATRIALADAGDSLDDPNFSTETANQSVLRLTTFEEWTQQTMEYVMETPVPESKTFMDQVFENEINKIIETGALAFKSMQFRDALKIVWFDMEILRSEYRVFTEGMYHPELIRWFIEVQALIMSPITPHMSEHLWSRVLKKEGLCCKQSWPAQSEPYNETLHRQFVVLQADLRAFRLAKEGLGGKKKKADAAPPIGAVIYVAREYKPYQQVCLRCLKNVELNEEGNAPASKEYMKDLRENEELKAMSKDEQKKAMQFSSFVMTEELRAFGKDAFNLELPFDEAELLQSRVDLIKQQLKIEDVMILDATVTHEKDTTDKRSLAQPAKPQIAFFFE